MTDKALADRILADKTPLFAWFKQGETWERKRVIRLGSSLPIDMYCALLAKWNPDARWLHPVTGEPA